MIHNLTFNKKEYSFSFIIITEVGKVNCKVTLSDKAPDGRPKLWADEYEILGVKYDPSLHYSDKAMVEGLKRLGRTISDYCDCNYWNLWSY